jgi:hypothetical protein
MKLSRLDSQSNDEAYHLMSEVLPTPPSPMTTILIGLNLLSEDGSINNLDLLYAILNPLYIRL